MKGENTVKIDITGLMAERFVNIATQNGASFFNVQRKNNGLSAVIKLKHLKLLRKASRKTGCKVRLYGRRGPYFLAEKLKKRFMLPIGFLLVLFMFWQFGQRIWMIEIEGNETMTKTQVLSMLAGYGVREGMIKDAQALRTIEQDILMRESFSHIGLKVKGITLTAVLVESKTAPRVYDATARCDIVAACDAVVESIKVYAGTALVKPGETVVQGQILISGQENGMPICALGDVGGSIWHTGTGIGSFFREIQEKTGKESDFRHLKTPWMYVIIAEGEEYEQYEKEVTEKPLLDGLFFGINLVRETYCETITRLEPVSYDQAKQQATELAYQQLVQRLPFGAIPVEQSVQSAVLAQEAAVRVQVRARISREIGKPLFYDND